MGMIQEFKEFAMKGNVVDMAVGIVIGSAFGKIVSEMVGKVIMPFTGYFTGGVDISKAEYPLKAVVEGQQDVMIGWGAVAQAIFDFIIVAFVIFLLVKAMNKAKATMEEEKKAAPDKPAEDILLLREIRDSLSKA